MECTCQHQEGESALSWGLFSQLQGATDVMEPVCMPWFVNLVHPPCDGCFQLIVTIALYSGVDSVRAAYLTIWLILTHVCLVFCLITLSW